MSQNIDFSLIQRVLFNGADIEDLRLNSNPLWAINKTINNPYKLDSSITFVKFNNDLLYKDGNLWKYVGSDINYNPCGSEWSINWDTLSATRSYQVEEIEDSGWQYNTSNNTLFLGSKGYWNGSYVCSGGYGSCLSGGYTYYMGSLRESGGEDIGYRNFYSIKRIRKITVTKTETKSLSDF